MAVTGIITDDEWDAIPQLKTCSKCKVSKPADQFGRDRNRSDGLTPWCKECQSRYRQEKKAVGTVARCSMEGCNKPVAAQGLCSMHRWRLREHGDPLYERP